MFDYYYKPAPSLKPLKSVNFDQVLNLENIQNSLKFKFSYLPKNIKRVTRVKYLGLIIDWNVRWNIHICDMVMKLRSIIF